MHLFRFLGVSVWIPASEWSVQGGIKTAPTCSLKPDPPPTPGKPTPPSPHQVYHPVILTVRLNIHRVGRIDSIVIGTVSRVWNNLICMLLYLPTTHPSSTLLLPSLHPSSSLTSLHRSSSLPPHPSYHPFTS